MRPRAPLVCSVSRDSHLPRGHLTHPEPSHQRTQGGGCCLLRFSVKLLCPTKQLSLGVPPAVLSTSGTPYGLGWSCFHRVLPRTWPWLGSKESFSESQGAPPPSSVLSHPGHSRPFFSCLPFHMGSKILTPHRVCEGRSSSPPSSEGFASCRCFACHLQGMCPPRGSGTRKMVLVTPSSRTLVSGTPSTATSHWANG